MAGKPSRLPPRVAPGATLCTALAEGVPSVGQGVDRAARTGATSQHFSGTYREASRAPAYRPPSALRTPPAPGHAIGTPSPTAPDTPSQSRAGFRTGAGNRMQSGQYASDGNRGQEAWGSYSIYLEPHKLRWILRWLEKQPGPVEMDDASDIRGPGGEIVDCVKALNYVESVSSSEGFSVSDVGKSKA